MNIVEFPPPLQAFNCSCQGDFTERINAFSRGQAKSIYLRNLQDWYPDAEFTDIRASKADTLADAGVSGVAKYRNVPFVKVGMAVRVGKQLGRIDSAGYGGAWFHYVAPDGHSGVFHPQGDPVVWFNEDGSEVEP